MPGEYGQTERGGGSELDPDPAVGAQKPQAIDSGLDDFSCAHEETAATNR
ncbi:hypothetical protein [Cellulomonas cellasea]|uniref:Uncharacterized protein n=1 Tax=Cellulomonas cellasea TaxID=43670 RepID=A0A7W4UH67_9CELL|nr:hypothetical protein [Cellulomonas cellasea]MBB2924104.1 hypothetical protein [Cellulomonas cellasea]